MRCLLFIGLLLVTSTLGEEQGKCRTVKDTMLTCLEATTEDLPVGKNEEITWLLFVRSSFPILKRDTMEMYPSLTDLHATNAQIETVEPDAFHDLKDLNWVDMSNNKLTEIDPDLFTQATNFYYLNVSNNANLVIPKDDAVINSPKLNWLDISYCGLKEVYPKTFTKLRGLKVLSLAGNHLTTLPKDVFQPLQNLYSLDLSNNQFQLVSPVVFKDMKHLSLYLGRNPWECSCELQPFIEWAKTRRMKDEVRCAKPEDKLWKDVNISGCGAGSLVETF